jgi:hypothetical protein
MAAIGALQSVADDCGNLNCASTKRARTSPLAAAREADAKAAAGRGAALHARGFQSDEAQDKARHAQEVEEQGAIAARKRLDTLGVEFDAARSGTFLGDSYNDAPSSLQRARELSLRITETQTAISLQGGQCGFR